MDGGKFSEVSRWVFTQGMDHHPSEIHGLLTGWLCAGTGWNAADRINALENWLGVDIGGDVEVQFERLYQDTLAGLQDEDLSFRLLLPEDDAPVNERAQAVSAWCGGFLFRDDRQVRGR